MTRIRPAPSRLRKTLRSALVPLLVALAGAPAHASGDADVPTIEWYMIDLPPIQMASGPLRGKGYTDVIRWRLIDALPGYRHVLRIANVQRILADIKTKPNVCNPAFLRTPEREQFMVYADPLHAQFPNGAVIQRQRREEVQRFVTPEGSLAVDELIEQAQGTVTVQSGRSYGVVLDGLIEKARTHNRVVTLTSNRPIESKLGMLQKRRAEVALMYPYELSYHLANTPDHDAYDFFPVEGNGTYTLNHLACSRSPLGERIIADANPVIAAERDGHFSAAYRAWIPESIHGLHAAHHLHAFGTQVQPQDLVISETDQAIATCLMDGGTWYRKRCEAGLPGQPRQED